MGHLFLSPSTQHLDPNEKVLSQGSDADGGNVLGSDQCGEVTGYRLLCGQSLGFWRAGLQSVSFLQATVMKKFQNSCFWDLTWSLSGQSMEGQDHLIGG